MAKYGVCITLPAMDGNPKTKLYATKDAVINWTAGYEIEASKCWTNNINDKEIAKLPTLNKAESIMLMVPIAQMFRVFPKVFRF